MHCVDTSVLVAYLAPEKYSTQVEAALRNPAHYPLALSAWTETELVSALGIKCRTGQINESDMQKALIQYETLQGYFIRLQVQDEDYRNAAKLLQNWRTGLRAGDALHLGIGQPGLHDFYPHPFFHEWDSRQHPLKLRKCPVDRPDISRNPEAVCR